MTSFAGWDMPVQYTKIIAEHRHTRNQASVFDISHMGEVLVSGPHAARQLGRLVTHDLENSTPGRCSYGFILYPSGTIMDDLIIYPLNEETFMLVVNASRREVDLAHLKKHLSPGQSIADQTMDIAKLDLQGPAALEILEQVTQMNWKDLKFFHFRETSVSGMNLLVSRTGYTGELGYELYLDWKNAPVMWERILQHPRARPAGLGARDTLRLEAGLPLYGQDLDSDHTPAEAGYQGILRSQSAYLGRDNASRIRERLLGLRVEGRRSPRAGDPVLDGQTRVGRVTSASFAPSLDCCVALAYVLDDFSRLDSFSIQGQRALFQARQTSLPFYQGTARKKL